MNDLTISAAKKRNVFKESFNLQEFGTNKHRDQAITLSIVSYICAFLNSNGGKLAVDSKSDSAQLPTGFKGFTRAIEQKLCGIFGCSTVGNQIHVSPPSTKDNAGLVFTVEASRSLFYTVNYNLHLPTETQIILIPPTESPDNIKSVLSREFINKTATFCSQEAISITRISLRAVKESQVGKIEIRFSG